MRQSRSIRNGGLLQHSRVASGWAWLWGLEFSCVRRVPFYAITAATVPVLVESSKTSVASVLLSSPVHPPSTTLECDGTMRLESLLASAPRPSHNVLRDRTTHPSQGLEEAIDSESQAAWREESNRGQPAVVNGHCWAHEQVLSGWRAGAVRTVRQSRDSSLATATFRRSPTCLQEPSPAPATTCSP